MNNKEQALFGEIQRTAPDHHLTPTQQQQAVQAALPHLRVGNFSEAAQKGIEQTLFPNFHPILAPK